MDLQARKEKLYREHAEELEAELEKLIAKGYLIDNITLRERFDVEDRGADGIHAVIETKIYHDPSDTVLTTVN